MTTTLGPRFAAIALIGAIASMVAASSSTARASAASPPTPTAPPGSGARQAPETPPGTGAPPAPGQPLAPGEPPPAIGAFSLRSSAFANAERIPDRFTVEGEDLSPPLEWSSPPEGTRSFAIVCEDLDTPRPFVHWVIYGIPSSVTKLPEGLPRERELSDPITARQGASSFNKDNTGYRGPATPRGDMPHRYRFTIYALKENPELKGGLTAPTLRQRTKDIVLGEASMLGTYSRARKPGQTPPGVQEKETLRPPPGRPAPADEPGAPTAPPAPTPPRNDPNAKPPGEPPASGD
ncbi:MAG: YbhB/YbcL family Raf kinase inhibitor-like protein [Phycisphaerae bacterium]|nr:YbhB/YbcL family Raf kinase inhibitor-like protein [Phycisphaerae bacterium]